MYSDNSSLIFSRLWSLSQGSELWSSFKTSHIWSQWFIENEWMNILRIYYKLSGKIKRIVLQMAIKYFISTARDLRLNLIPTITIWIWRSFQFYSPTILLFIYMKRIKEVGKITIGALKQRTSCWKNFNKIKSRTRKRN